MKRKNKILSNVLVFIGDVGITAWMGLVFGLIIMVRNNYPSMEFFFGVFMALYGFNRLNQVNDRDDILRKLKNEQEN